MPKQDINIGVVAGDANGDPLRVAFNKVNDNFTEVYAVVADIQGIDGVMATVAAVSGSDAVISVAADPLKYRSVDWISWSYAGIPVSGGLRVLLGGVLVYQIDITADGPGHSAFGLPLRSGVVNQALEVRLINGSAAKKLSIRYR